MATAALPQWKPDWTPTPAMIQAVKAEVAESSVAAAASIAEDATAAAKAKLQRSPVFRRMLGQNDQRW